MLVRKKVDNLNSIEQSKMDNKELFLADAIDMDTLCPYGMINVVCAPVGSGKTSWALNELACIPESLDKVLYLIDTRNGNQSISKHSNAMMYSDEWLMNVKDNIVCWDEYHDLNKVAVITYAKFGVLATRYDDFVNKFDIIICDELHNLPKFAKFNDDVYDKDVIDWHKEAIKAIKRTVRETKTMVVALTATPGAVEKEFKGLCNPVIIKEGIRHFETKHTKHYANVDDVVSSVASSARGILYFTTVREMKEMEEQLYLQGFHPICIWSTNNKEHELSEEQLRVRNYLIEEERIPEEYNALIINSSCGTSINIYGDIDYMLIHSTDQDTITQVRGRYRSDLDTLYLHKRDAILLVPEEFLNRQLFKKDKDNLCKRLKIKNENGRLCGWPTVKLTLLKNHYYIKEGRTNVIENGKEKKKTYAIVTREEI